ncbi:MAG: metallophosphoesterase [Candidatus Aenigmatarchaeota archaeon]
MDNIKNEIEMEQDSRGHESIDIFESDTESMDAAVPEVDGTEVDAALDTAARIKEKLQRLEKMRDLYTEYLPRHVFEHKIDVYHDIIVLFISDWHLGSVYTDYQKASEMWDAILGNDRVYVIVDGDMIDNFEVASTKLLQAGISSQLITPALQREILMECLNVLKEKGKLLAIVLGNHESFTQQYPFAISCIPVALNRMFLKLKIGFTEYKIAVVHKSRYNSTLNPLHSSQRELTVLYPDADVVVSAHTHLPVVATYPYPHEGRYVDRVLIKLGTIKSDEYTTAYFSHALDFDISPSIVFGYIDRKMTVFTKLEDAIRFIKRTIW